MNLCMALEDSGPYDAVRSLGEDQKDLAVLHVPAEARNEEKRKENVLAPQSGVVLLK